MLETIKTNYDPAAILPNLTFCHDSFKYNNLGSYDFIPSLK